MSPLPNKPRMDEIKYELPEWLPWATTACLAAIVACLCELWLIERSRSELLREQGQLAEAAVKASENQLEAERIMTARQIQTLSANADLQAGLQVIRLSPPDAGPSRSEPAAGIVIVDPVGRRGQLRLYGAFGQAPGRDYQLWIDGPGPDYPARCGVFHAGPDDDRSGDPFGITAAIVPGCQFVLIDGAAGGDSSLEEAKAGGSIVLASPPFTGKF
jgi:hypothetical protein